LSFPSRIERSLKATALRYLKRPRDRSPNGRIDALQDLSLELRCGDRLGVIGTNGSGKTSLLQVMSGIYPPVRGRVSRSGSLVPLLQLGLGFNPELTGRENILLGAALMAIPRRRIRERTDSILDFCELSHVADVPVKYYSTGMAARLAFAVATEVDTDILLLDEVFAVGDIHWVKRAVERLDALVARLGILVVASHSEHIILHLCNRCVQLEGGRLVQDGPPEEVLQRYREGRAGQTLA
jgi:ABC-type polysaccharide/polyol phosphate transport system ATPase subunit